jgi:quercetin dioxygenase-like cupin family protein/pyrroloquinoline quinone (PQQ) biosynthesis protein C
MISAHAEAGETVEQLQPITSEQPATATGGAHARGVEAALREEMEAHPLWSCRLLRACNGGHLRLEDWRFIFGQYALYSTNFTRFLSAAMANCPNDYYRARLAQNLWEEGGMQDPRERHAEIFRSFLREGLEIDPAACPPQPYTQHYVEQVLGHCLSVAPAFVAAFLSLGTEATVPRLYGMFHQGLLRAGVPEQQLRFFTLHMACDDEHAATLLELMGSYAAEPDWEVQVREGMRRALDLRLTFFEHLFEGLRHLRLQSLLSGIQDRRSLASPERRLDKAAFLRDSHGRPLYSNCVERLNVEFTVERIPFPAQVIDARLVYIPPGRCNERHKHAHESLFYVLAGTGRVLVGDDHVSVGPGDMVFVPRWVLHQTENLGTEEMRLLAITDFGFTGRAFIGDYDRTARMKREPG